MTLDPGARAIGRTLAQLALEDLSVEVRAVRRSSSKVRLDAASAGALQSGDVVVLLGAPAALAEAEGRLR